MLAVPARVWMLLMAILTPAPSPACTLLGSTLMGCGCSGGAGVALSAVLTGLVGFTGVGMGAGFAISPVLGVGAMGAGDGFSVARTLSSSSGALGGSGISLTMVAWMAPAVAAASPQLFPECETYAQLRSSVAATACSANEPANPPPNLPSMPARRLLRIVK